MDISIATLDEALADLETAGSFAQAQVALKKMATAIGMPVLAWSPDVARPAFDHHMDEFFRNEGWADEVLSLWWARAVMLKNPIYIRCRTTALPFVTATTEKLPNRQAELRHIGQAMRKMDIDSLITVPVHLPRGLVAMVSMGGPQTKAEACAVVAQTRSRLIAAGHLFMAVFAAHSAKISASEEELARLTPREWECLRLTAQGCREEQVASTIGLGATTVRYHLDNVVRKLGASNRTHAVALAAQLGLLGPIS